jgi:single-strand DNA-binding protein
MRLAVNHRAREKKETSFFDVVTFGQLAETCGEYLSKGRAVLVDGRLREHSWDAPDGGRRSRIEVVAASVEFLDAPPDTSKGRHEEKGAPQEPSSAPRKDEEPPF